MAGSSRPKGYIYDWKPQTKTLDLLNQIQGILDSYSAHLPMTARQIFYRLVGVYDYDKTEQAYSRLCELLVKARRAGVISFKDIRDDGTVVKLNNGYDGMRHWWCSIAAHAERYTRNRNAGQDFHIEVWCEAAGMAPQLAKVALPYGGDVYSTGGFSSVTVTYETARRISRRNKPTVFMHIGDFDPSGESIFTAMAEDIHAFVLDDCDVAGQFIPVRVALTEDQVIEHDLPMAPPKRSDSRSRNWVGDTCQAEAMDPSTLASTLAGAIESYYDMDVYDAIVKEEEIEREQLIEEVNSNIVEA